jgi:hypothetical protein
VSFQTTHYLLLPALGKVPFCRTLLKCMVHSSACSRSMLSTLLSCTQLLRLSGGTYTSRALHGNFGVPASVTYCSTRSSSNARTGHVHAPTHPSTDAPKHQMRTHLGTIVIRTKEKCMSWYDTYVSHWQPQIMVTMAISNHFQLVGLENNF